MSMEMIWLEFQLSTDNQNFFFLSRIPSKPGFRGLQVY